MKTQCLLLGTLLAVCAACARLVPTSAQRDAAAISALRLDLDAAVVARDADRVSDIFTEDSVYLQPDERAIVGRTALTAFLREAYRETAAAPKGRRVPSEVKIAGDWAFEWGQLESIRPPTGGAEVWIDGKYLHVYQRQADGRWQIARASYNANPPQRARLASR